ncbi:MAG: exonuclease [Clostridia bacterium]|nr:exonuclease [Clostridia bacterium]
MRYEMIIENGIVTFRECAGESKETKRMKGKSIIGFPLDYVLLDLETTGLDPLYDEIIEFAALRIRDGSVSNVFQTLIKPSNEIPDYITELTGITNEMVADSPSIEEVINDIYDFIGNDIVVAHNSHFDINFLYDNILQNINKHFSNNHINTVRIARKCLPEIPHHRLSDLVAHLNIKTENSHRALSDCYATYECVQKLYTIALTKFGSIDCFIDSFSKRYNNTTYNKKLSEVSTDKTIFDETHPLYGQVCVFTGKLERMNRLEAAQLVVNFGGIFEDSLTQRTNYLILSNSGYHDVISGKASSKYEKATKYKLKGQDIEIISEDIFYDLVLGE